MDIYKELLSALETEEHVMLATVISTSGSTPSSALSKMLVKQGGSVSVGTVGGGCMEGDVVLHANRLYSTGKAELCSFELNEEDMEGGLICGGKLDILIEPVTRKQIPLIQKLQAMREIGEDSLLLTHLLPDGEVTTKDLIPVLPQETSEWSSGVVKKMEKIVLASSDAQTNMSLAEIVRRTFHNNSSHRIPTEQGEIILEPVRGTPSLLIFGGGHVSKFVSQAASLAGFRVTIIDDREKFANAGRFPEAVQTFAMDFGEALERIPIKESTYVVIITRGHQYDEEILKRVIKTPARYIGMIGSKRKVLTTYEHLAQRGISVETMRRVHAPIGIEIGAVTAEEIAISVVAEIINTRRGNHQPISKSEELKKHLHVFEKKK
ncbi:MAG: XdhC/CoxI family protein [Bacteroidetes bacterium]|nr:MAG: XdhC/CoxI family protein [Bacteroidota bacterium]